MSIKSFQNDKFSIWNITSKIRDDVQTLKYDLTETGASVYHDDVKEAFSELLENDILEFHTVSNNTHGYREYQLNGDVNTPATPIPDIKAISVASTIPKDVQKKMYVYLKNNGEVTMKQIQSRLKGHPYTCAEIKDFLAQLHLIDTKTLTLPVSQVKTCNINL